MNHFIKKKKTIKKKQIKKKINSKITIFYNKQIIKMNNPK